MQNCFYAYLCVVSDGDGFIPTKMFSNQILEGGYAEECVRRAGQ
jgi:hypothetical protein